MDSTLGLLTLTGESTMPQSTSGNDVTTTGSDVGATGSGVYSTTGSDGLVVPDAADQLLFYRNCVAVPLCVAIIVGNVLVVACVFKVTALQNGTNYLVLSLGACDLLTGGVLMPLVVFAQMLSDDDRPDWMCNLAARAVPVIGILTTLQILSINIERLIFLQFPLHCHAWMTTRKKALMVYLPWVITAIYAAMTSLTADVDVTTHCVSFPASDTLALATAALFLVPFCAICVIYTQIWRIVKKHFEFKRDQATTTTCPAPDSCMCVTANPQRSFHLKVIKTIAAVVGTLTLSWGLYVAATLAYAYVGDSATQDDIRFYVIPLAELMVVAKSALNPLIFAFWFPRFQKALSSLVRCPCSKPESSNTASKYTTSTTRTTA